MLFGYRPCPSQNPGIPCLNHNHRRCFGQRRGRRPMQGWGEGLWYSSCRGKLFNVRLSHSTECQVCQGNFIWMGRLDKIYSSSTLCLQSAYSWYQELRGISLCCLAKRQNICTVAVSQGCGTREVKMTHCCREDAVSWFQSWRMNKALQNFYDALT